MKKLILINYLLLIISLNINGQEILENGLYISFKNNDENWISPIYLGDEINKGGCASPFVSPDGKYLFFNSFRNGNYDICWASAKIIEELKPKK